MELISTGVTAGTDLGRSVPFFDDFGRRNTAPLQPTRNNLPPRLTPPESSPYLSFHFEGAPAPVPPNSRSAV
jgi:hypothetical protein